MEPEDLEILRGLIETLQALGEAYDQKSHSIKRLLKMIFGAKTEKAGELLNIPPEDEDYQDEDREDEAEEPSEESVEPSEDSDPADPSTRKGKGRYGHLDFTGAETICIPCDEVTRGGICPKCQRGKTYPVEPERLVRVSAEAPLSAKIYELEKYRCNACGTLFKATPPQGVSSERYDSKAIAMLGLLHYGTGMPFHRLEKLHRTLGIPLSSSTQWDWVERGTDALFSVFHQLIHEAAQGKLIHNDDTPARILEFMGKRLKGKPPDASKPHRSGLFTTGIISKTESGTMAIFYTGTQHAGENLNDLLGRRMRNLPPPIQMCDGLDQNIPKEFKTILSNCNAHSRRKFVELIDNFPEECRYVIIEFLKVYRNDALARDKGMSSDQRLKFHQEHSEKIMLGLRAWMLEKFDHKDVEPNSGLGQAFTYFLKRWEPLTLFLREPGVPLDNNICERALKKSILTRKNSLFYKTQNGARVGDLYTSIIHTCELHKVDPFNYMTQVLENKGKVRSAPEMWMPWNYKEAISLSA